ncbi:FecR family protein [Aliamphritea hakodatensis]|uniref:FecR family protein n=1 Tax=Aliamphritea hakodatensis TaxID=2895352 RepID=UPI0022FD7CC6|nr:FecR domain-containing protein [Aliamphritea hakodatensis]
MSPIHSSSQARQHAASASQDEALDWFLTLQADPENPRLKQAFVEWKDSHPDNESLYLEVLLLWDNVNRVDEAAVTVPAEQDTVVAPAGRWRSGKLCYWLGASLCCLLLFMTVFVPGSVLLPLSNADYVTASGEQEMHVLEDGSRLYLSGGSAVDVAMTAAERRVALLRGDAFFEVAKDPLRPFRVIAGETLTTAVGTAFNISLSESQITVTLTEGIVDSGTVADRIRLNAGQELLFRAGQLDLQTGSAQYWPAWKRGMVSVEDMSVSELVTLLNRHYSAVIRSVDPRLLDARVSGILPLDDLPTTLQMLQQILGIRHLTLSDSLVLLHR